MGIGGIVQEFAHRQNRLRNRFAAFVDPSAEEPESQETEKMPEVTIGDIIQKAFEDRNVKKSK